MESYNILNNKNICDKALLLATKDFLIDSISRF